MNRNAWTLAAACAGRPDLPWTTDAAHVPTLAADAMRSVCGSCPVVLDCLAAVGSALSDRDAVAVVWTSLRTRSGRVVGDQGAFDLFEPLDGAA